MNSESLPTDGMANKMPAPKPPLVCYIFQVPAECVTCKEKFMSMKKFRAHLRHPEAVHHVCWQCELLFNLNADLVRHFDEAGCQATRCTVCNKNFSSPSGLKSHQKASNHIIRDRGKIVPGRSTLSPSHGSTLQSIVTINDRRNDCDGSQIYKGEVVCNISISTDSQAATHRAHADSQTVVAGRCMICDEVFRKTKLFAAHCRAAALTHHLCPLCKVLFRSAERLKAHYEDAGCHVICLECKKFFAKSSIQGHQKAKRHGPWGPSGIGRTFTVQRSRKCTGFKHITRVTVYDAANIRMETALRGRPRKVTVPTVPAVKRSKKAQAACCDKRSSSTTSLLQHQSAKHRASDDQYQQREVEDEAGDPSWDSPDPFVWEWAIHLPHCPIQRSLPPEVASLVRCSCRLGREEVCRRSATDTTTNYQAVHDSAHEHDPCWHHLIVGEENEDGWASSLHRQELMRHNVQYRKALFCANALTRRAEQVRARAIHRKQWREEMNMQLQARARAKAHAETKGKEMARL